ncbi:hypothetical protein A2U01_0061085, partial [Trifolium medium]|nr:hypothetical protein [Trifolium medium]
MFVMERLLLWVFPVRGALIAMAMVMVQISEASDSRVGTF